MGVLMGEGGEIGNHKGGVGGNDPSELGPIYTCTVYIDHGVS